MAGLDHGYGVLKGRAIAGVKEIDDNTPHYQIHASDGTNDYRLAVNVRSKLKPYDLLYLIDDNFNHPILTRLTELKFGFTEIPIADRKAGEIALDYIRGNLFDVTKMQPLPFNVPGDNNDLNEVIDLHIQQAIRSPDAELYAFGEPWYEPRIPDKIFGFPGRGIHNLHMNQGSSGRFGRENGVYQDGAILIHYSSRQQWVAAFFSFQSQSFHTDDRTGDPLVGTGNQPIKVGAEPIDLLDPVTPQVRARVRIVAALVNPPGDDVGRETVTLFNASPEKIDLTGWAIADRLKRKAMLSGIVLEPNATTTVRLSGQDVQLSNDGGIISLLDAASIKMDGVAYTKEDARQQGWAIVF
jgi:uncharacterized protein YukJ